MSGGWCAAHRANAKVGGSPRRHASSVSWRQQRRGGTAALASLLTLFWALAFVVQTWGLAESGPLWLALGRAGFAVVPFLALPFVVRAVIAGSREMHRLAFALGVTNVAAFLPLQLAGLDRVGAGVGATVIYVQPVLVLLGAYWVFGEPLSRRRVIGIASAFAGVVVIGVRAAAFGSLVGVLLLLGAAVLWTAGSLFLKEASRRDLLPLLALRRRLRTTGRCRRRPRFLRGARGRR